MKAVAETVRPAGRPADRVLIGGIALLTIVLAALVADTIREKIVSAGDSAPDFKIVADNGRTITRKDFGGRILVLNFWATWCPPCIEEMPSLDAFQKRFASRGVVVLGVSVDQNEGAYKKFLQRAGVSFLTARDPEGGVSADYGTFKYPETYIIDANGRVIEKYIGPENWMDPAILSRMERL